jgi:carbamate kinase
MRKNARMAAERVADVAARGWEVVVTHGNGPQVGRILLQNEAAKDWVHPMPLDVWARSRRARSATSSR